MVIKLNKLNKTKVKVSCKGQTSLCVSVVPDVLASARAHALPLTELCEHQYVSVILTFKSAVS